MDITSEHFIVTLQLSDGSEELLVGLHEGEERFIRAFTVSEDALFHIQDCVVHQILESVMAGKTFSANSVDAVMVESLTVEGGEGEFLAQIATRAKVKWLVIGNSLRGEACHIDLSVLSAPYSAKDIAMLPQQSYLFR